MCGIAGIIKFDSQVQSHEIDALFRGIERRGPDGRGYWLTANKQIAFVHTRLSIIDLTDHSAQPMRSHDERFVLTYNGEIYNYLEIRRDLESHGVHFESSGDTEVLLKAVEFWGLELAVTKLNGMFAFALYDNHYKRLHLVRDRIGVKPLHYYHDDKQFIFASDLASIIKVIGADAQISKSGLSQYLFSGYLPGEATILNKAHKLLPGNILTLSNRTDVKIHNYYSLKKLFTQPKSTEAVDTVFNRLEQIVKESTNLCTRADVPVGLFLSGGIDSSLVASMLALNNFPAQSFSVGFSDSEYNESEDARKIAAHLNMQHNESHFDESHLLNLFSKMPDIYSEPFADVSQFPTYFVSTEARKKVKVSLSGDGGDELFAGYNRYLFVEKLWNKLSHFPKSTRNLAAVIIKRFPHKIAYVINLINKCAFRHEIPLLEQKLLKAAQIIGLSSLPDAHFAASSQWINPNTILTNDWHEHELSHANSDVIPIDITHQQLYLDMTTYLVEDILTKTDRASMAAGLEVRVPLLDHNLVEYAISLPMQYKLRGGETKWAVKKLLERYLPSNLIYKPKRGFGIPIDDWLRGPLKEVAGDYLSRESLLKGNIFNAEHVSAVWDAHLAGRVNKGGALWTIVAFEQWRKFYF